MGSPFTQKVAPAILITERQLDFLCSLQRQILALDGHSPEEVLVYMDTFELQARALGKAEASQRIDLALAQVRELEALTRQKQATLSAVAEDIDGFWELPDGRIVKVQIAVHGSGRPYGKVLDETTGRFNMVSSIVSEVRKTGTRLTLDRAKELGHLYGMCIRCGATLTDENSIAAGIGPYCATKF